MSTIYDMVSDDIILERLQSKLLKGQQTGIYIFMTLEFHLFFLIALLNSKEKFYFIYYHGI